MRELVVLVAAKEVRLAVDCGSGTSGCWDSGRGEAYGRVKATAWAPECDVKTRVNLTAEGWPSVCRTGLLDAGRATHCWRHSARCVLQGVRVCRSTRA